MPAAAESDLGHADTLWKAADALRGQVDATEYVHIVIALLFFSSVKQHES
jgi:type I restriction enzyme M protein